MVSFITDSDIIYVLNIGDNNYTTTYVSGKFPRTFYNVNDVLNSINEKINIVELPDGKMFFPK